MYPQKPKIIGEIIGIILLIIIPLLGAYIFDKNFIKYLLEMPPKTQYIKHHSFSPLAFFISLSITLLLFIFCISKILKNFKNLTQKKNIYRKNSKFPFWGYIGLLINLSSWILMWGKFNFIMPVYKFLFFFLWLGYIIFINAITFKRNNYCLITNNPLLFILLFIFSAIFWWIFEYLNRFVQNWHYIGIESFSKTTYILTSSLSFSTVLPAVISTFKLLESFPIFNKLFTDVYSVNIKYRYTLSVILLIFSCIILFFLYPLSNYLFPFLWIIPITIVCSLQILFNERTIFYEIKFGNWYIIILLALGALICGFLWELWNYYSILKWEYTIPFLNKYKIFEMPLLGYLGYLPFGIECGIAWIFIEKLLIILKKNKVLY